LAPLGTGHARDRDERPGRAPRQRSPVLRLVPHAALTARWRGAPWWCCAGPAESCTTSMPRAALAGERADALPSSTRRHQGALSLMAKDRRAAGGGHVSASASGRSRCRRPGLRGRNCAGPCSRRRPRGRRPERGGSRRGRPRFADLRGALFEAADLRGARLDTSALQSPTSPGRS
jgi:hypothetical protein